MRLLFHSLLERMGDGGERGEGGGGERGDFCLKLDAQGQGSGNILDVDE